VIGFASIAGGAPSSARAMTNHLMNATLQPEQARLAAYYARGMVREFDEVPKARREQQNEAHFQAWMAGMVAPDLVRLAEYAATPDAVLSVMDIEDRLVRVIDMALARADGEDLLAAEVRSLHGLPEPEPLPAELQGSSLEALRVRRDRLIEQWSEASIAAEYTAEVSEFGASLDPNAPIAIVRPDLHPSVAIGLGIGPTRRLTGREVDALLAGRRADGEKIAGKHYATERRLPVDPRTGEERYSGPIGSYDFCPTPDKSVSVAWAFARPVEQARIYNAHIEAARDAVGYIADRVGQARIGDGGKHGAEPGHIGWLEFTHHTSRRTQISIENGEVRLATDRGSPGDPDLHTHFLIPNAVFCESGRVGSLDTAGIGGFIFEADAFYQACLGRNLRDAGFEVELDRRTGAAHMPVIPADVCELFSKRTRMGELLARKVTADRGEDWDGLSQDQRDARMKAATQDQDQKVKGGKDDIADFDDWRRQAREFCGWHPAATLQLYGPPLAPLEEEARIRMAYDVALPFLAEKLEHKAVVPHFDLRVAAGRGLVAAGIDDRKDLDAVTAIMRQDGVLQYGGKTALVWGIEDGKRYTSVTTSLHEADEQEFIALARAAATDRGAVIPARLLEKTLEHSRLDLGGVHGRAQRTAIERLAYGGRFGIAIGAAGAGKSAMLKPLVSAWREQGRDIYGAALAWRQADQLSDVGIEAKNVAAFSVLVDRLRDGTLKLTDRSVLAIDELGLLGTRQALELLRLRDQHGFSIVAMGDDKQCESIQAGAIIDLSRRALGAEQVPQILTTVRQHTERERLIVGLLREGRAAEALDMKRADGAAEMVPGGYDGVVARAAKLYSERLLATGEAPAMSAPTNSDAHRISVAIRQERRSLGQVGPDLMTVRATDGERNYTLALARGDRIRLFRSTGATYEKGRGGGIGRNGSVLEVIAIDHNGLTLQARTGKVGTVRWSDLAHPTGLLHLAYGDAMTVHTAQGTTAREHILALPGGSRTIDGKMGYSGSTRHRHLSFLLTNEAAEREDVRKRRPLNDPRGISLNDLWANVARSLSHQPEKDLAVALFERVSRIRRGSVRQFQKVMPDVHRAQQERQAERVLAYRRLDRGLQHVRAVLRQFVQQLRQGQRSLSRQDGMLDRQRRSRQPSATRALGPMR